MDVTYCVTRAGQVVGQVHVRADGLYSDITCTCQSLPAGEIYRLWIASEGRRTNLGVLYPLGAGFRLCRRVPKRELAGDAPIFTIQPSGQAERFVPVSEDAPFFYLHLLMQSRFAVRDGVAGLLVPAED